MREMLQKYVEHICDETIRSFVNDMFNGAPSYFYTVAASSSGKYHPEFALGEGGLVRHTAAACAIAEQLFVIESFSQEEKDIIVAAILLHDTYKHGMVNSGRTEFNHPAVAAAVIRTCNVRNDSRIEIIADCVAAHMGQWNTSKYSDAVLSVPSSKLEKFVHQCDYLASRKMIEVKFD